MRSMSAYTQIIFYLQLNQVLRCLVNHEGEIEHEHFQGTRIAHFNWGNILHGPRVYDLQVKETLSLDRVNKNTKDGQMST